MRRCFYLLFIMFFLQAVPAFSEEKNQSADNDSKVSNIGDDLVKQTGNIASGVADGVGVVAEGVGNVVGTVEGVTKEILGGMIKGVAKDVVVIATRLQTPYKEIGDSVTIIDSDALANKVSVARAMKMAPGVSVITDSPGVNVVSSGGLGQQSSVFIRGAKSEHSLVLIDGVEINDPISPGRSADLGMLQTTNIDRIEILRGAQSTLYGSDAMAGVVNIFTKKGSGKPKLFVESEVGSFETVRVNGGILGGTDLFNYSFESSYLYSQGFSTAIHHKGNSEEDYHENTTIATRLGLTPTESLELSFIMRYINANTEQDTFHFTTSMPIDDKDARSDSDYFLIRTQANWTLFDDLYEQVFGFSMTKINRETNNPVDSLNPTYTDADYDSRIYKFDYQHNLYIPTLELGALKIDNVLTAGIEGKKETGESENRYSYINWAGAVVEDSITAPRKTANTWSFFLQDKIAFNDTFFTTFGARWDDHSIFGSHRTMKVVPTIFINATKTKLKFSYGTGFKAPSLYQFYSSAGNMNLRPEKSYSWDLGFEQSLFDDKVQVGITYFQNDFKNLIDWVWNPTTFTGQYLNIDSAETNGLELFANWYILDNLRVGFNYTYNQTKETRIRDGEKVRQGFIRRPKNFVNLDVDYKFWDDKVNLNCEVIYVGGSIDNDFSTYPATRVRLEGYTIVNLNADCKINDNISVFGKIHNLLDDCYEQVLGYGTERFSIYGGVRAEL